MNFIKFISIFILSIMIAELSSFDFLGIKSGMTKEEVKVAVFYDQMIEEGSGMFSDNYKSEFDKSDKISFQKSAYVNENIISKYNAYDAYLYFDSVEGLWQIEIYYFVPDNSLEKNAKLEALNVLFPNSAIIDYSKSISYGSIDYWVVKLIDTEIYDRIYVKKKNYYLKSLEF